MQAIVTKYYGPGNVQGSRVVAKCDAGRVSIPYRHELSGEEVHRAAAVALCDKLNAEARKRHPEAGDAYTPWNPAELVGGALPNDSGYAFVIVKGLPEARASLAELCLMPNKHRPERVWDAAREAARKLG
jgi:hypothetical protein